MKKKLIICILALVCAMACAFAFTACGGSNPKKMKSDVVTEEQWKDALKADNFKNVKIESTTTQEAPFEKEDGTKEQAKVTVKYTVMIADGTQYYKSEATVEKGSQEFKDLAKEMTFEKYSSESDGKYTTYYKNKDGKWRQCPDEGGVADDVINGIVGLGTEYDKFEYTEGWAKGYWFRGDIFEYPWLTKKVLKFQKGKLAAIFYENEQQSSSNGVDSYESDYISTTFTYGGQSLTLPTSENSSYAGAWTTHQLLVGNKTYNVGDAITEMGGMTLAANFVNLEIKNDGTFTSTNPEGSITGVWMETDKGICYAEKIGESMTPIEFDGTNFKIEIGSDMTVLLKKA